MRRANTAPPQARSEAIIRAAGPAPSLSAPPAPPSAGEETRRHAARGAGGAGASKGSPGADGGAGTGSSGTTGATGSTGATGATTQPGVEQVIAFGKDAAKTYNQPARAGAEFGPAAYAVDATPSTVWDVVVPADGQPSAPSS